MGRKYCTSSRWHKAVERLRDEGQIEDSTKDIGKIIQEVHRDMDKECKEMIAEELYQDARKKIMTAACQGLADWYKDRLIHGASFTDEMGARKLEN